MPQTLRCSTCGTDWPPVREYAECPRCESKTFTIWDGEPLSQKAAKVMVGNIAFGRYYQETRGVPQESEADPSGDPHREAIGMWCDHPEAEGFICWACDQIPRRPDEQTDFEKGLFG